MRRVLAIFLGVSVAVGLLAAIGSSAGAVGPPLSQYVVYGENGIVIGHDSTVIGLVGARNNNPDAGGNAAINLSGGASVISDPANSIVGDARTAGNTRMANQTLIQGTLTHSPGTTVTKQSSSTIGAEVVGNPELPTLPPATVIPGGCPTAGASKSGANNKTESVGPGTYGNYAFGSSFTLNFTAPGNYYFTGISGGNGSIINSVVGVHVFICGAFNFGSVQVLPTTLKPADFTVEAQSSDFHNAFRGGGGTNWIGNVYTPNGGIHIGSGGSAGTVKGQLLAGGEVDLEHGLVVTGGDGGGGGGGGGGKDATLDHAAKNENNGANKSLRVRYQEASVIGFDLRPLPIAQKQSVILELTVCNTPGDLTTCPIASNGWPAAGGRLQASRLDDGWERWGSGFPGPTNTPPEGNGNNFPINNNPRGTGAGVTWNCAIDTNIANQGQDCTHANGNFWNAGLAFDHGNVNSTELLTDNMPNGTKVHFDVTALYNEGIGPLDTAFMSFFIRKNAGTGSGFAEFWSFQGAALVSPASAPKLITVP